MERQKRTSKTLKGFAATRGPRDVIKQAASDLEQGQENTDCRGMRGAGRGAPASPRTRKRQ